MIQIRLYGADHQQKLIELQEAAGARTLTKMLEQLIDAAHAQLNLANLTNASHGGSNDSNTCFSNTRQAAA